jgi:hypothetical protein
VDFVNPTPDDAEIIREGVVSVNVSLLGDYLDEVIYNWNGTNYTVYNESLVLSMNFNNFSSLGENNTFFVDISNYSNNGSCSGSSCPTKTSSGKYLGAFTFDGVNDYIDIADHDSLELNSSWTISSWVKRSLVSNSYERLFYKFSTVGNQRSYGVYIDNNNRLSAIVSSDGTNNDFGFGPTISDTGWHFIAVTFDEGDVTFYVDSLSSTDTFSQTSAFNSTTQFRIGSTVELSPSQWFNGSLDNLMVWNRSLSQAEINQSYMSSLEKYDSDLWSFFINQTKSPESDLDFGNYTYRVFVSSFGVQNSTEERLVIFNPYPLDFLYPTQNVIYQRHNSTTGEIKIIGNYTGSPSSIETRFNGGNWVTLDSNPSGGTFNGTINASVGQGILEIRFGDDINSYNSISNISLGDLFVIGGQSNAEGRANNAQSLNGSNEYYSTVYREDDVWLIGNDPIDNGTSNGSPFPLLVNNLIQNQSVPVGFISVAKGGTNISLWQKGQPWYDNMHNQIAEATNGTMKVKSLLFHQGETDSFSSEATNYSTYKEYLSSLAIDFLNDTFISEKIVVAQIGEVTSTTVLTLNDIRRAQQDSWDDNDNISAGPILYDIVPLVDGVHLKTDLEIQELASRWSGSVLSAIYGTGDGRGPIINNITLDEGDNDTITLNFTEISLPLKVEYWNGTSSSSVGGFNFTLENGSLYGDEIVDSISILNQNKIEVNLTINITSGANISFGDYNGGEARGVIKDSSSYSLPAEPFYNYSITYVPIQVDESSDASLTNSGGSSTGTFKPYESNLESGYNIRMIKNQKIEIPVGDLGEKKTIVVESISGGKVVLSVDGTEYGIYENSSGKIDLNGDGFYDVEIMNKGNIGNSANLEFKSIHEEIPKEEQEEQKEGNIINEIPEIVKKLNWKIYVGIGIVVVLIVSLSLLKKKKSKR